MAGGAMAKAGELIQEAGKNASRSQSRNKRRLKEAEEGDLEVKGKYVDTQAESMEMEVMMSHGQELFFYHDDAQEGSLAGFGYR